MHFVSCCIEFTGP
ncbi:hypothetical protein OSB04_022186 [Centaurea solstitialis]|uniref:Uncharacterized protein n=1 Tax=Centaurea solstitialis TaxID=347529 RepID=A0AA38SVW3_9ASTR|nr:hypothetical protein OSB04_022186 [Centaurea solstitialis]